MWTDLLDPTEAEIAEHAPKGLRPEALAELLRPADRDGNVRPTLQGHGAYVFGVLLAPVAVPAEDRVFYQEINLVATRDTLLTVRKTPGREPPFALTNVKAVVAAREQPRPGAIAYHLFDEVAEDYLNLLDDLDDEIDELEAGVDQQPSSSTHKRLSELRHDLLHVRRRLAPTRDAARGVVDGRTDIDANRLLRREVFPREVEAQFARVYEKLLRATESLEFARDLLAAVRDYHQTRIANDQNDVVRRLTAIASLLLFPTFIVGVYGQNFRHMPELDWKLGYGFSWLIIVAGTIVQMAFFKKRGWL